MSARFTGRARRSAVAAGVVAVFAMGAAAYAAVPNADGNIYACYSNGDGSVRVQSDPAKPCAKNWSPLKWSAGQPDVPVTTTYWKRTTVDVQGGEFDEVIVSCDDGDIATGGGFEGSTGGSGPGVSTHTSIPYPASGPNAVSRIPTGWWATMENDDTIARGATVYVVCQHTE